ncbi:GntR family transcriptional regulator [Yoonia sp. R2331]|uniref:GntR family transcriptional regulator n=1 Tax=Yoonia sp. R2331 TaxID=3237238 RepID=UPI0034E4861D
MTKTMGVHQLSNVRKRAQNASPTSQARFRSGVAPTLAESEYQKLRDRIVSMELLPGAAISESELAAQSGVSRTPVREAVLRLAREDLLEVAPKSGTFVARIPVSVLPEALIARRALEGVTAVAAAKEASRSQKLELHALLERQREFADLGDFEGFHASDEALHQKIAEIGRLPGLWAMVQQVKLQIDRFRRLTLPEPGRMHMALGQHTDVVTAIENNEPEVARQKMDIHLNGLQHHIKYVVDANPDFFIHDADLNNLVNV